VTAPPTLTVDTASPVPPYEQIRAQLAQLIQHGLLAPGDRLPPVRQLAADLGLAVGTVARAYRELEQSGQVRSRRGAGTTVTDTAVNSTPAERSRLLAGYAAAYVAQARQLGFDYDGLLAAVRRAAGG
jgi:DNA-binding transcriptional regulator YhcF (GntR family)